MNKVIIYSLAFLIGISSLVGPTTVFAADKNKSQFVKPPQENESVFFDSKKESLKEKTLLQEAELVPNKNFPEIIPQKPFVPMNLNDPTIDKNSTSPLNDRPSVSLSNGALAFEYPLDLPKGRLGQTPELSFGYSSQNTKHSIVGHGWDLQTAWIARTPKYGVVELYDHNEFVLYFGGQMHELKSINLVDGEHGQYGIRFSSGIDIYIEWNLDDSWTLFSSDGTEVTFGASTDSRQDDANDFTNVAKWMIDRTEDTNGNYITYEYYKDSGQIYPAEINYSRFENDDGVYSVRI